MTDLSTLLSKAVNEAIRNGAATDLQRNIAKHLLTDSSAPEAESTASPAAASSSAGATTITYSGMGWGDLEVGKLALHLDPEATLDYTSITPLLKSQLESSKTPPADLAAVSTLALTHQPQLRGGADGGALADLLAMLPSLTRLDLAGCNMLRELPDALMDTCPHVNLLNLNGCTRLMRLPAKIGGLAHLESIDARNCETLEALPKTLGECSKLCKLLVSQATAENGMTIVPDAICELPALEHLELGCSNLKTVPAQLGELTRLQTLIFNGADAPSSLSALKDLAYLEMQQSLTSLPEELLPGLTNLRILDLGSCMMLRALPATIGTLAATLEVLYLGSMEVAELPASLCELRNLAHLELLGCASLKALPDGLGQLSSLVSLHIKKSAALTALPDSIGDLAALEVLKLSECVGLSGLPTSVVKLAKLRFLEISDCTAIGAMPAGYGALTSLMHLDFSGCEDLADLMYDDPVVDELEARGCGMFGPGFEIEPAGYDLIKAEFVRLEEARLGRLGVLRGDAASGS